MKGLNKLVLASAITAISVGAQAELKALDDSAMGELTGQAGITIDLETEWTIGEFAYKDAGFVVLQGLSMGGSDANGGGLLDNIRLTIDVAGATPETVNYGFSEVIGLAKVHVGLNGNPDTTLQSIAGTGTLNGNANYIPDAQALAVAKATYDANPTASNLTALQTAAVTHQGNLGNDSIDLTKAYGDGDLSIHFGFTDAWKHGGGYAAYAAGSGASTYQSQADLDAGTNANDGVSLATLTYDEAIDIATRAVDFNFSIDAIGLAEEAYTIGSAGLDTDANHTTGTHEGAAGTTTLISDLHINGYLGPADLHISNNGNGFSGGINGAGTGDADSKITWGSYFKVTDLDVYIDIAGVQLTDITINNIRGDETGLDGTRSFGFAHSIREIYAVKDDVLQLATLLAPPAGSNLPGYVDGVAINTRFKGDLDIGALSFGDSETSIGSIYLTDINSTTNWTISAH